MTDKNILSTEEICAQLRRANELILDLLNKTQWAVSGGSPSGKTVFYCPCCGAAFDQREHSAGCSWKELSELMGHKSKPRKPLGGFSALQFGDLYGMTVTFDRGSKGKVFFFNVTRLEDRGGPNTQSVFYLESALLHSRMTYPIDVRFTALSFEPSKRLRDVFIEEEE